MALSIVEKRSPKLEILEAMKHLDPVDIEQIYRHVARIRASTPENEEMRIEAELLRTILRRRPREFQRRYRELIEKRRSEMLSTDEIPELRKLTNEAELFNVRRVEAIGQLAQIRGTTMPALMEELGIRPPASE